jgi:hypothetical protein
MKNPSAVCLSWSKARYAAQPTGRFPSDGGEDVRNVQLYLKPQAEHLLDWFHLTMRLTDCQGTAGERR